MQQQNDLIITKKEYSLSKLENLQCNENPLYVMRGLSPNFHSHVSVSDLYVPIESVHIFFCSRIGRPIPGIYKSLTDTRMLKVGLRPHNYFSGNICFEFSA
jgi:hypothetical protein